MVSDRPLKIGIVCDPSVSISGSGILATRLGEELAHRGHEIHFITYERPFRLRLDLPRTYFHPVHIKDYIYFKYPDYVLPLSVKMAEVSRDHLLDVLHVHYAVPHATAAILARSMLPPDHQPMVVTTLHGTDTLILGRDPGYGPAIRYAVNCSDAVTTVSAYLQGETRRLVGDVRPIEVIYNFFVPRVPTRSRQHVRRELGIDDSQVMVIHLSNLRPLKRVDLLLEVAARIRPRDAFKLVILAGDNFAPFAGDVQRLGLEDRVVIRERVDDIEEYLQASDLGMFTSETESFCLGILEVMWFASPSVATSVGGIPEVIEDNATGILVPFGDVNALVRAAEALIQDPTRRVALGQAAQQRARKYFSADVIVPRYEALYRRALDRQMP